LYRQCGLASPNVGRRSRFARPHAHSRTTTDGQRQLLRACQRGSASDRALVVLMLFTG
jgi:hypothetical protein